MSGRPGSGPAPRRLLTDWTPTAGVAGDGLLAIVDGTGATAEGVHRATRGYEVMVLGTGDDLTRVHHVDVAPAALPEAWRRRFALVVTFEPGAAADLAPTVADGGLLVVLGDAGLVPDLAATGLTEVQREEGPDPDGGPGDRFRLVAARV